MTNDIDLTFYQRLLEISQDLASTLDLNSLLMKIVVLAKNISAAEDASILLNDPKSHTLHFRASTNQSIVDLSEKMEVPFDSIAGWTATHKKPLLVDDVNEDVRFYQKVDQTLSYRTKSILAVPLIIKEELIGVLEVINKKQGKFREQDIETLSILSAQAAIAITNARLFEQTDLVAELVHEIRTPLTSINTITHLLQQENLKAETQEKLIETIQNETSRLSEMLSAFLEIARLESGRSDFVKIHFNFWELLQECIIMTMPAAHEKNLQFTIDSGKKELMILADRKKIKQVLLNLISNAINYSEKGGKIWLNISEKSDTVIVEIGDDGKGIAEGDKPHIFTKFFRSKTTQSHSVGTGLGLAICKKIIEGHQGQIWFESEMGKGSRFYFSLPLTD